MITKENISPLLSDEVILEIATPSMWNTPAHPQEQLLVQNSVQKRKREFATGRACARLALQQLGFKDFPLLADAERVPIWPKNIIGSISHTNNCCIAVAAQRGPLQGIGIDIEETISPDNQIQELICVEEEQDWLSTIEKDATRLQWLTVLFSAKESIYKALYPKTRIPLEFTDLYINIDFHGNTFEVEFIKKITPNPIIIGKYLLTEKHAFTSCEYLS